MPFSVGATGDTSYRANDSFGVRMDPGRIPRSTGIDLEHPAHRKDPWVRWNDPMAGVGLGDPTPIRDFTRPRTS
jgi:hypothetical protein